MEVKYQANDSDWSSCIGYVDTDKVVELPLTSVNDRLMRKAKVKLYGKDVEGSQGIELIGSFGQPHEAGKYFVKVIEFIEEEE